ncbi:hypothetical protein HanRHA438_Chr13g0609241 [Helianthus annuus]|uniref:Transposase (Putative), gypsy type n=1 Tax=Helianthus annuus TaxID=4232 RepID=A0A9K3EJC6_HELAN|nr:hypothetical protein HanXRQr2_Chr13g0598611 [Helianthus annuus]KAJ0477668.1 hypothetical protein HanHA300_Chr13g0491201 [Helianthus annuus]KAJ0482201.1 hypothetical protein HanIR_Chr13g0651231 [Helianthus annuus]KAJ0498500.1 hypothetical protein HanHA89_Chr13g0523321 [Helianthus annuus]KAJ0664515.1 hypothetical protein HanLR1_Chr13g0493321 [Helianthus annuus]
MSAGGNPTRKRKYKPKNPPGPDRAEINWKEDEFQNLVRDRGFRSELSAQFPTPNSTALDAPSGYIALYAAFFREGNFRLPITKFTGEVLTNYGLHISANRFEPTFEKFNVFYFLSYTGGFYSFNSRTGGVNPCSANSPKSLHDWKQKFFYIHRGVIPIDMHYHGESEWVPRVNVSIDFAEQEWYKVLTRKVTSITQLEERALVAAGMSMLWAPQNRWGVPVYGYQWKAGYSLMNVLDPQAGGAMVVAYLPEGRPVWLDRSDKRSLLAPYSESLATYANSILGEDGGDDLDDAINPTREEVIVLSSEGSDGSHEGLIPRSTRAGPSQGTVNEPVNEPVVDDVKTLVDTAEQLETRKKKKVDKSEGKKAEETAAKAPRKRPSNSSFLDYVVVSDTLSGLDAGDKRAECDPDDDATLTGIVKKKKSFGRQEERT